MADVSTLQPVIFPDAGAGAEPRNYWSTVGERLAHDRITLAVGAVLLCVILLAIFAPWAATHDPLQGSVMRRLKPIGTPGFFLGTDETGRP
jgi:peptide/nickel transport system permease protein